MELKKSPNSLESKLENLVAPHVDALGYELLDLEYQPKSADGAVLRLFIDNPNGSPIGFEDCTKVDHGLDTLITAAEFDKLLPQGFSLEVSSPGIDRPLKKESDFVRFTGKRVQIKTYRAITLEEMKNAKYFEHHQKQKNFFGILRGISEESVLLEADTQVFSVPFSQIIKANLDIASQLTVDDAND